MPKSKTDEEEFAKGANAPTRLREGNEAIRAINKDLRDNHLRATEFKDENDILETLKKVVEYKQIKPNSRKLGDENMEFILRFIINLAMKKYTTDNK